jgi:hypothetical protein
MYPGRADILCPNAIGRFGPGADLAGRTAVMPVLRPPREGRSELPRQLRYDPYSNIGSTALTSQSTSRSARPKDYVFERQFSRLLFPEQYQ